MTSPATPPGVWGEFLSLIDRLFYDADAEPLAEDFAVFAARVGQLRRAGVAFAPAFLAWVRETLAGVGEWVEDDSDGDEDADPADETAPRFVTSDGALTAMVQSRDDARQRGW